MIDRSDSTLVLAIEGLPTRHCWPVIPSYGAADTNYTQTLREPPGGASARWEVTDQTATVGGWDVEFAAGASWYKIQPSPVAFLARRVELGVDWELDRTPAQAGLAANDYVIVDRETVRLVGPFASGSPLVTAIRDRYGSEAQPHKEGAAVYRLADPPALSGRRVTIWRVSRTSGTAATSEVDANVYLRGHIPREVRQSRAQRVRIDVHTGGDRRPGKGPQLNAPPRTYAGQVDILETSAGMRITRAAIATGNENGVPVFGTEQGQFDTARPLHSADGAYVYYPDLGAVLALPWTESGGFDFDQPAVAWLKPGTSVTARLYQDPIPCYQVVCSDPYLLPPAGFPVFGYLDEGGIFVPAANPAIMAANLIVSKNGTGGIYDRGAYLYPSLSLGLDYDRLDWPVWRQAIADCEMIEARNLWLGGPKPRDLHGLLRALLAPCGLTPVVTQAGLWTLARLSDLYPDEGTAVSALEGLSGWESLGRPLDRVVLQTDPGPDGESYGQVSLSDLTASEWFPREMGGTDTIELAPYKASDLQALSSELAAVVGARLRRLGQRMAVATLELGATDADGLNPGDGLRITDPLLRDPIDGTLAGLVPARIVDIESRTYEGTAKVEALLLDGTARLALRCPSAEVRIWDATNRIATVKAQRYAKRDELDARQFVVGDNLALYTRNGAPRSDVTGVRTPPAVTAVDDETITVGSVFLDTAGATVVPVEGDIVSYCYYPQTTVTQTASFAFMASGGIGAETLPTHASAAETPYVFGD